QRAVGRREALSNAGPRSAENSSTAGVMLDWLGGKRTESDGRLPGDFLNRIHCRPARDSQAAGNSKRIGMPSPSVSTLAPSRAAVVPPTRSMSAITAFVAIALIASWVAAVLPIENSFTTTEDDGRFLLIENKTALYYAAHAMAIASVMAAGLLSVLAGRLR